MPASHLLRVLLGQEGGQAGHLSRIAFRTGGLSMLARSAGRWPRCAAGVLKSQNFLVVALGAM